MADSIRIAVIDDHPLFREGVVQVLRRMDSFDVVAEGGSAADAVRAAVETKPDLILLDVSMPGGGIAALQAITKTCPTVKALMLTVSEEDNDVFACLEAGACGYILKGVGSSELVRMIQAVRNGEMTITPSLAARLLARIGTKPAVDTVDDPSVLTPRENEILDFVARGQTNKEVARTLRLSEKTVKHYMTSIMQKLHVRNRVEAAIRSRRGMTQPDALDRTGSQVGGERVAGKRLYHPSAAKSRPPTE
jgi:two-component system, NarL family, nitrate/nitrite response regulator NarL